MTTPLLLFVDGIDGSGKSTLARQIAQSFVAAGLGTFALSVDDFRKPVDWQAAPGRAAQLYYEDYFELGLIDDVIRGVMAGQDLTRLPVFIEGQPRTWRDVNTGGCQVILLEGVFTQRLTTARNAALVYVHVDWQMARERIMARDQAKGRTPAEVTNRIDERYLPGQRRYETECLPYTRAHWLASLAQPDKGLHLTRTGTPLPAHPLWASVEPALYEACGTLARSLGQIPAKNSGGA